MPPDLYRGLSQISFLFCLCFVLLLTHHLSPFQARTVYPLFLVVCSKQAHLFWGRAITIIVQHNFALFLQDKGPWLAEMANWQVNAARNTFEGQGTPPSDGGEHEAGERTP